MSPTDFARGAEPRIPALLSQAPLTHDKKTIDQCQMCFLTMTRKGLFGPISLCLPKTRFQDPHEEPCQVAPRRRPANPEVSALSRIFGPLDGGAASGTQAEGRLPAIGRSSYQSYRHRNRGCLRCRDVRRHGDVRRSNGRYCGHTTPYR